MILISWIMKYVNKAFGKINQSENLWTWNLTEHFYLWYSRWIPTGDRMLSPGSRPRGSTPSRTESAVWGTSCFGCEGRNGTHTPRHSPSTGSMLSNSLKESQCTKINKKLSKSRWQPWTLGLTLVPRLYKIFKKVVNILLSHRLHPNTIHEDRIKPEWYHSSFSQFTQNSANVQQMYQCFNSKLC